MEEIGDSFKDAQPRKWLGNEVPFPMNPTFKPPPPLSSEIRERMYNAFMQDPEKNSVRALAQRYHVSIKRVDAILRLKGLEKDWQKQGKQLQTGFQAGMEKLLMVKSISPSTSVDADRYDVHEADTLEHDENRDASRQRYQRLYWESTPEDGREPVVPGSLEHATFLAKRFAAEAQKLKANPKLMPRIPDKPAMVRPQAKIVQVSRPGRATLQFVDVGAKFMDVNERVRRIVTAKRKARRSRI
ncbi:eukaryotic mitochondrial regulator protein-domain-containing protein [Crucibulum laeve]|uniref:Eukaryotic mitochondrial regulator protein-domain-containing protein n=1 Tax=Crucibulum laeve TaxID=68775 RepID=A0A5C3MAQ1_9AGAR|nr:eukaryotic mitochondrial regulator protein-domain-containing protein [Crucibulum laeve]